MLEQRGIFKGLQVWGRHGRRVETKPGREMLEMLGRSENSSQLSGLSALVKINSLKP